MFTKSKIVLFTAVAVLLLGFDYWLFSTIAGSFRKLIQTKQAGILSAVSESLPEAETEIESWIDKIRSQYEDFDIVYLKGNPLEDPSLVSTDPALTDLYRRLKETPDFEKAMESVSYQEKYYSPNEVRLDGQKVKPVYVPVLDPEGYDTVGTVLFLINEKSYTSFETLLSTLGVILFAAVMLILGASLFSREPIVGYAILLLFLIIGLFVVYPLFEAFRLSFMESGGFSASLWLEILQTRKFFDALGGSVLLGITTASIATIIGFIFAFFTTRTNISAKWKKTITAIANLPIISPPFSLTLSLILLFGNNGLITRKFFGIQTGPIYGLPGLIVVQTITMFSIAFASIAGVLQAIDSTMEEASMDLQAGKLKTFLNITLPLSLPGILSSWLLVFTTAIADFANPLLLGGSFRVLSVEAYLEVVGINRIANGTVYAIMLLFPTMVAFFVQRYWVTRKSYVTVTGKPSGRLYDLTSDRVKRIMAVFIFLFLAFIVGLYLTIVAGCFVKNWGIDYSFTLGNIVEAFERGSKSVVDTVSLAVVAAPVAGILGMMAAFIVVRKNFPGKRLLELLILTPFAIPGTLIGISFVLAFNKPPVVLVGTGVILVIAYVIRELPLGLENGSATLRQVDPAIEEAAADLGADSSVIFRTITLPLIQPAFVTTMSFTFVRAMTAVSTIIFLVSPRWYHMTVLVYNFAENMRFGLAAVMSTVLIGIVLAAFGIIRLLFRQSVALEKQNTRAG